MRALVLGLALTLAATPALATPVSLVPQPTDDDGVVTLGELFDGAGQAAGVRVAVRTAPTVVLDAAQVQTIARRNGLVWANETGIRRIIVRSGGGAVGTPARTPATATRGAATVEVLTYARSVATGQTIQPEDIVWTTVQSHQAPSDGADDAEAVIGLSARRPLRAGAPVRATDLTRPQVIARGDMVDITYESGGIRLTLRGRALEAATVGEPFRVQNVESGRTIEVVATEPGRALAGPAAQAARTR
ncbi:flagellar basal body P-ring formation chaperone FlgA [Brevundimonas aveniformis]|uniref:flagellar basal body P-ring formation chaperone FlgA n=1 Tax=Brevundimonas aveniformis TaxID=370977 RepID=UPI002492999F|nr:flagellar basal body P-ring formation chaperone FlgA [Brevundimonas aveniformis]